MVAPGTMTRVVVCVCTYRRPLLLARCIASIIRQERPVDWTIEITVVDNDAGSRGPAELVAASPGCPYPVHWLVEPRPGIPFARNAACRHALALGADWILFIDDDEEAESGWLLAYRRALESMAADVYSGPVRYLFPEGYEAWIGGKGLFHLPHGSVRDSAATNNVMFSARLLEEPWGLEFDTGMTFTGGSDNDFFMRLARRGGRILLVGDALVSEVVDRGRLSIRWRLFRQFSSGANRVYTQKKLDGSAIALIWAAKEIVRHLLQGTAGVLLSPLYMVRGYSHFKRRAYHGLRHYAKMFGLFGGVIGVRSRLYRRSN